VGLFLSYQHLLINVPPFFCLSLQQGCRIFLVQNTKRIKYTKVPQNIPKYHKRFQNATKYTKPPKIYQTANKMSPKTTKYNKTPLNKYTKTPQNKYTKTPQNKCTKPPQNIPKHR
jgi:hypothetical protein